MTQYEELIQAMIGFALIVILFLFVSHLNYLQQCY